MQEVRNVPGLLCILLFALVFPRAARPQSLLTGEPTQQVVAASIEVNGKITVGSTVYSPALSAGVHIVAINRQTLQLLPNGDQTFNSADAANQFLSGIRNGSNPDAIILLSAFGNYGFGLAAIAKNLEQLGAQQDIEAIGDPIAFNYLGNGGLQTGQGYQTGYPDIATSGYFAKDSKNNYTFIRPDYVRYDILPDGTVQIGDRQYPVSGAGRSCTGSSGFHMVVVQRDNPSHLIGDEAYCEFSETGNGNPAEVDHLLTDLRSVNGDESKLVFFAAFGRAFPDAPIHDTNYVVGVELQKLGEYTETFFYATNSDSYSLVGAAAPPANIRNPGKRSKEVSSVYPDKPSGAQHGYLGPGRRGNWYSPISADLTRKANMDFYKILALPPAPFPHPNGAAELAAFQYIGSQLCGSNTCNVRDAYGNQNAAISDWETKLQGLNDPNDPGHSCDSSSKTPFCLVKAQLLQEFSYVTWTRQLYGNLTYLWLGSGNEGILSLLEVYQTIKNSINPAGNASAPDIGLPVANLFLTAASAIPDVGPVFGIADAVMNLAVSLADDQSGNKISLLSTTVAEVENSAINTFNQQQASMGTQFDFIYQDSNKLQALGAALEGQSPAWVWDAGATGRILMP
jgi:hypothetical protein